MRRNLFAGVLAGVLSIGCMQVGTEANVMDEGRIETQEQAYYLGDVDENGKVDLSDAQWILKECLKVSNGYRNEQNSYHRARFLGDVDGNGELELKDVQLALKSVLHVGKEKQLQNITTDNKETAEWLYKTKQPQEFVTIIENEEALNQCIDAEYQEYKDQFADVFDEYHILAVYANVHAKQADDVDVQIYRNGQKVLAEVTDSTEFEEEASCQYVKLMCVDKELDLKNSVLYLDCDGIGGRATIIEEELTDFDLTFGGKGTVPFSEATQYKHLIRNTEELKNYRSFLKNTFSLSTCLNEGYYSRMNEHFFKNRAYAVFTYNNCLGSQAYKVQKMQCIDGVLHVKLLCYDTNPGAPGFVTGVFSVFVSIPSKLAAQAESVELEVVKE